jgi:hypothetical protein
MEHEEKLNRILDKFSVGLVIFVGTVSAIIGLSVMAAFWYWVMQFLF